MGHLLIPLAIVALMVGLKIKVWAESRHRRPKGDRGIDNAFSIANTPNGKDHLIRTGECVARTEVSALRYLELGAKYVWCEAQANYYRMESADEVKTFYLEGHHLRS